jgi:hypothetical protein
MNANFNSVVSLVTGVIRPIVGLALLVAIATAALKMFGVRLPVAAPGAQELAYLAGAFWLISRATG